MDKRDQILTSHETKYINPNPFQLQHPFRAVSCGSSGSGKTYSILKNILMDPKMPFHKVVWVAPEFSLQQPKLQEMKKLLGKRLEFVNGLDEERLKEIIENKPQKEQMLIVLDDLLTKTDSPLIKDLFISGRHKNISTIEILQQVYAGKSGRSHRLNCDYFILHNFPDRSEAKRLFQQLEPSNYHNLMKAYETCIQKSNGKGFLMIDNKFHDKQSGANLLRYRANALDHVIEL